MNIFVTVGTTSFDSLVQAIDQGPHGINTIIQTADGKYAPNTATCFKFQQNIQEHVDNADIVVCHAGAGSVFRLIQNGLIPLVVPNTERRDKHQLEIARWLTLKKYAVVAMTVDTVNDTISNYPELRNHCVQFSEKRFFFNDSLNQIVRKKMFDN